MKGSSKRKRNRINRNLNAIELKITSIEAVFKVLFINALITVIRFPKKILINQDIQREEKYNNRQRTHNLKLVLVLH